MFNLSVATACDPFPFSALIVANYVKDSLDVSISFDGSGCILTRPDGTQIEGDESVVRTLAKASGTGSNSTQVCNPVYGKGSELNSLQGEALIALAKSLPSEKDFANLISSLDALDNRLALRTFLDGKDITIVDWLVWGAIKGMNNLNLILLAF